VVRHTLDLPLDTQAYEVLAMKLLWLPITTVQQGNAYLMPLVVHCGTVKPTVTHLVHGLLISTRDNVCGHVALITETKSTYIMFKSTLWLMM